MKNDIRLKSVWNLMEHNFFVPSYQRGYRWEKQQVEDLLSDIFEFMNNDNNKFYCLQPLVVKKCSENFVEKYNLKSNYDNNIWYEVIDGQQRLTTIKIILKYIQEEELSIEKSFRDEYGKDFFNLTYERNQKTDYDTGEFLNNLNKTKINEETEVNNLDCEYIKDAYLTIKKWIEGKSQEKTGISNEPLGKRKVRGIISKPLIEDDGKNIRFIFYEINNEENAIESFRRLNSGKIPLTSAELIKALFLLNIDKKRENIKVEIANEWDKIENALRDENFWCFLTNMQESNNLVYQKNRICFIFDFVFSFDENNCLYGTDENKYFRMFYNKIANNSDEYEIPIGEDTPYVVWKECVRKTFKMFYDWYKDDKLYHYIGYLVNTGYSLITISETWNKSQDRNEFIVNLKEIIKKELNCKYINKTNKDGTYNYILAEYESDNKNNKINKLLLLLNIQYIITHIDKKDKNYRFDFNAYRRKWDIEHIDSRTENTNFVRSDKIAWIEQELEELAIEEKKEDKIYKEMEGLLNCIKKDTSNSYDEEFNLLRTKLSDQYNENKDDELMDNICNLALLGDKENRSYKNSTFPVKRRKIIEWDKEGRFIPICTKHCFLKYFSNKSTDALKWSKEDMIGYNKYIFDVLDEFLEIGEENE